MEAVGSDFHVGYPYMYPWRLLQHGVWIGCLFTPTYVSGGCVFARDCGWNGWNVYAVTGYTRLFPTGREGEGKHSVSLVFLPPDRKNASQPMMS